MREWESESESESARMNEADPKHTETQYNEGGREEQATDDNIRKSKYNCRIFFLRNDCKIRTPKIMHLSLSLF